MKKKIISTNLSPYFQDYQQENIKIYNQLEVLSVDGNQNIEQWDIFCAYSSQKMINLVDQTRKDQKFLPILAFDMHRISNYVQIKSILRPYTLFALQQLIVRLKNAKQSQKDVLVRLIVTMINHSRNTIQKHRQMLNQFDNQCLQCCIYELKNEFKIGFGFKNIKLSTLQQWSSCQSLLSYFDDTIEQLPSIYNQKAEEFIKLDKQTIDLIIKWKKTNQNQCVKQSNINQLSINDQQALYQQIMLNYTSHIFDMIHSTIIDLTQILLNEYLQQNSNFNTYFIAANDPVSNKPYKGQIYHNINCVHFEGLSYQTYSSSKNCPICGEMIVFSAERVQQVGRNIFQMVLLKNPVNPASNNLVYYFNQKVFILKKIIQQDYLDAFSDYYHYLSYVKRTKNIHNRQQIVNYHKYESINLYNKIKGIKKYYSPTQLIKTPVRGRYCHHWQFYDLKRVYSTLKKNKTSVFNCFVCLQQINAEEIIYLQDMSHLISLSQQYFPANTQKQQYRYSINIDHKDRTIVLSFTQNNNRQMLLPLQLYQTLEDPLSKSRYVQDFWYQKDKQIHLSAQFCTFFFGK